MWREIDALKASPGGGSTFEITNDMLAATSLGFCELSRLPCEGHSTSPTLQQLKRQSSERMRRNQGDHAIATEAEAVHPVGQPISASTNSGFSVRR